MALDRRTPGHKKTRRFGGRIVTQRKSNFAARYGPEFEGSHRPAHPVVNIGLEETIATE
jgi:hypothetical protein